MSDLEDAHLWVTAGCEDLLPRTLLANRARNSTTANVSPRNLDKKRAKEREVIKIKLSSKMNGKRLWWDLLGYGVLLLWKRRER